MKIRDPRIEEEIRHHISERTDRLVAEGCDPDEARRRAEAAFGDPDAVRRQVARIQASGRAWPARAWDRVRADVRFAVRQLAHSPAFALAAIVTLGLGIGASAAIFAMVNAVVLEPLPYPEADRVVLFQELSPDGIPFTVSDLNFRDYRERLEHLELLSAWARADYATTVEGEPVQVVAGMVTGDFFRVFGGPPLLGRTFTEGETGATAAPLVVLAHDFWMDRFGGDERALGSTLLLDEEYYEIVGVMPASWEPLEEVDVWTPLALAYASRDDHDYTVVGKLAPGASPGLAAEDIQRAADQLGREHPETNRGWSATITPLKDAVVGAERVRAGRLLLAAVTMLLLMACASVSNLLLARASARGGEMALRASLGAGRSRLVQQLLTESLLLAAAGTALGLALAYAFLPVLRSLSPPGTPRIETATIDGTVLAVAGCAAVAAAVLFGLAPVLHVLRDAVAGRRGARATGGSVAGGGDRLRGALVVGQVALSLTLLVGAGALGRSFLALQSADPGLPLEHTLAIPLMMSGDRYTVEERRASRDAIVEALDAVPGVEAVGSTNVLPFSGMNTMVAVNVEGRPTDVGDAPFMRWRAVSETFMDAADLAPLAGRTFSSSDYDPDAEAVVVLTEATARMLFGDAPSAVGERIAMGWDGRNYRTVVGVVGDVEDRALDMAPPPLFFWPDPGVMTWVNLLVRLRPDTPPPPERLLRQAVWSVDPGLPVPSIESMAERFHGSVAGYGFNLMIVGSFAAVALALAVLGIYGLVLFGVRRRTREIGVRIALGARPERVAAMIAGQGLRLTAVGVVAGLLSSVAFIRVLESLLYGVRATHPAHFVAATLVLSAVALGAALVPASQATTIEPSVALTVE